MQAKTFRLFISSTFSDFKGEREIMQTDVFPKLDSYCAAHGFQFQAIDLRWGVNEEAQLDQKTIEVCLNEVNNCKHYPHPNFLIMLGNRYGWIPLPYAIEKKEFEQILNFYLEGNEKYHLLKKWYLLDENHLFDKNSFAYVIKSRKGKYKDYGFWEIVESKLRKSLQNAVNKIDSINNKQKYFVSATENEVIEGVNPYRIGLHIATNINQNKKIVKSKELEYIYGFIRDIKPIKDKSHPSIFFDSANKKLLEFKENIQQTLIKENLLQLKTSLVTANKIEEKYLITFKKKIFNYLKSSIEKQITRINTINIEDRTKTAHLFFKRERLHVFVGRDTILKRITNYTTGNSNIPLIIYAKSGMGKTSLMAKAIDDISNTTDRKLIYRFVGADENATNIRSLLISIITEIDKKEAIELKNNFDESSFNEKIATFFSKIEKGTIIFIDALDQLVEKTGLKWLPDKLPANLKLIVSVLKDEHYKNDSDYFDLFKVKYNQAQHQDNFIQLNPLSRKDASTILSKLLFKVKRTLTKPQHEYVLDKFEKAGNSPLYLSIAFEEVRKWKSVDSTYNKKLKNTIIKSVNSFIDNLHSVYFHQKLLVYKSLGYLQSSKNGLSEKEIIDVLSVDQAVIKAIENQYHKNLSGKIPLAPWARLFSQLSPFLIEKMSDNVLLINLFHRQFSNAINTNILDKTSVKNEYHLNLAKYFKKQALVSSEGIYNLRKLSEQAYHFYNSNQVDELLNLFEQNYINIKYELDKLYDCLYEIERTYILIVHKKNANLIYKKRLFSSILKFFSTYTLKEKKLFDFNLIHTYFVYRKRSDFYSDFLEYISNKKVIKRHVTDQKFVDDYFLHFLSGLIGLLRREGKLEKATFYINKIINEYQNKLLINQDDTIYKDISKEYYELGYVSYLNGEFNNANTAFAKSINFAQKANNVIGEWITKCVMTRINFLRGTVTNTEFYNVLDDAYSVFQKLESTNHVAKRWMMVVHHHKFEVCNANKDLKMMKYHYDYLHTNAWNKEFDVKMDFYKGQIALIEGKYSNSISSIKKYINSFNELQLHKEEAFAEVYYNLGVAYNKNGDSNKAKLAWKKALAFKDEPGNHIFKKKCLKELNQLIR